MTSEWVQANNAMGFYLVNLYYAKSKCVYLVKSLFLGCSIHIYLKLLIVVSWWKHSTRTRNFDVRIATATGLCRLRLTLDAKCAQSWFFGCWIIDTDFRSLNMTKKKYMLTNSFFCHYISIEVTYQITYQVRQFGKCPRFPIFRL